MALVLNDRVKETTTSTGTGTINLAGAETGFETFVAGVGNSNTCYYCIAHQSANEFEVGLGTVTDATPDTLARTTIISSSNSDSAVNFSAGTKDVFCTLPASKVVFENASDNVGIGTASPTKKLHVEMFGDAALFDRTGSAGGVMQFANGGTVKGNVGVQSGGFGLGGGFRDPDLFIDTGGDVGIGTTSPAEKLEVSGDIKATKIGMGISPIVPCEVLSTGATSTALRVLKSGSNDSTQNNLFSVTEISGHGRLSIHDTSQNEDIRLDSNGDSYFNGGDVAINKTTPTSTLDVSGTTTSNNFIVGTNGDIRSGGNGVTWSGETDFKIQHYNTKVYLQYAANGLFLRNNSGNDRMELDASGNATFSGNVTAYGTPSDIRLKENIEVIDNALDKVKQLKGITYDLKSDGNRLTGLIAQDLEKVLPEAVYTTNSLGDSVNEEPKEHLAIRYGNTVGLLVEAIKEQQEQIETLAARVKELEGK